jgi:phosphatidylserine/phosphatidylglycerophosphate/cardiolipin synthase-like enzyme
MTKVYAKRGIAHCLEQLVKTSKKYLYLVNPYVTIDCTIEETICEAAERAFDVTLIFGKYYTQ